MVNVFLFYRFYPPDYPLEKYPSCGFSMREPLSPFLLRGRPGRSFERTESEPGDVSLLLCSETLLDSVLDYVYLVGIRLLSFRI